MHLLEETELGGKVVSKQLTTIVNLFEMRSMSAIVASLFSDQMTEVVAPDIYRAHWAGVASSAHF